ncbi:MAG: hypothetical protein UV26_C0012G0030 [candidate division WWE3 bacterium GW2011_GWF2_42_42]|uniref:Uncharacterized protein n=1 Tax=candidate division WWE3 bacterium GW2011_GWF2_42_42 TaxID=1619142 RepID=A0A0G1AFV8_UNCKA|nr:MAG: hypothetical protein UV26_C0012G0030 [candidate division WWE3 bacterium GW2011_GWF2_42_42]
MLKTDTVKTVADVLYEKKLMLIQVKVLSRL